MNMKRYENLTKEAIIEAINKPDELPDNVCTGCIVWDYDTKYNNCKHRCANGEKGTCLEIIRKFLNEEISTISRWKTFTCDEDVQRSVEDWYKMNPDISLINYLCEKVEIK